MTSETDYILSLLEAKAKVTRLIGNFVSDELATWTVDVAGGWLTNCIPATAYLPEVNEPVHLWLIDGTPYVIGPTTTKASEGVVVSVAANIVTLSTNHGQVKAAYNPAQTPSSGETWRLIWGAGPFAVGKTSTSAAPPDPPVPPGPPGGSAVGPHEDIFTAIDAASYGSGRWFSGDIYAADSSVGSWWYGSKIKDTLRSSAVIQTVEIYLSPLQVSGAAPNFALHSDLSRPGGAPSFGASSPTSVAPQWVQLPNSFGDALKTGGASGGVGINHGGYSIFRSLGADGMSGALRIRSIY